MQRMVYGSKILFGVVLVALVLSLAAPGAEAAGDWSYRVAPYLWTTRINGVVGPSANPADVDVSFKDLIENADLALAGLFEATYKEDWGFMAEGMYADLSTAATGPKGGKATLDLEYAFLTLAGAKRVAPNVDVYAGARGIFMDTTLKLSAGGMADPSGSVSKDWWDPIIGFKVTGSVNEKLSTIVAMDVGGFGVSSEMTYQVVANLIYEFNPTWSAIFGYRLLDIDYDKDGFVFDTRQDGLILGLGISW